MAESQGMSRWVGDPVPQRYPSHPSSSQGPAGPGAANRIPPEIMLRISKHLDIKDLARAAVVWRSAAQATYASPEFIKAECARFSLLTNHMRTWAPDSFRQIRDRIEQYNFAWTTLQYTFGQFFSIPETTAETMWLGSHGWRSGNHFMGESNGYLYDACSWEAAGPAGPQMWARVCLYDAPSLRTGEVGLKRRQFNVNLQSHYVKAVAVEPVAQVVGILEYNLHNTNNIHSRIPYLHVYSLKDGQHIGTLKMSIGFQIGAEVSHMEMHGEMVCIIAHYPAYGKTVSEIHIQHWAGATRIVSIPDGVDPYITGFQFITEDMFILTKKAKLEARDQIASNLVQVGSIRTNKVIFVNLRDVYGNGWTVNDITLVRNISSHQPVSGAFSSDPSKRLFALRFDYTDFKGLVFSNACLFGRTTVESWLGIYTLAPVEPMHWAIMRPQATADTPSHMQLRRHTDPTNREGCAIIGRRLFWSEIWPNGWSLNVLDYNPGAAIHVSEKISESGGKMLTSWTYRFCEDPYTVSFSVSSRIDRVDRVIPTEDGLLLKKDDHGVPTFMALLM